MSLTVAVTGARGYLGGWTCYYLRNFGHTVVELPGRSTKGWEYAAEHADTVIHLAWYSSAGNGNKQLQEDCVERTAKLLHTAKHNGTRVVFASTASVYGNCHDDPPRTEEDRIYPNCSYTIAKAFAEVLVRDVQDWVTFRMGSLMGTGLTRTRTDLVVNHFAQTAYLGGVIECQGPENWKPVVHVRDAALIIAASADPGIGMQGMYNLVSACPNARTIAVLANLQTGAEVTYTNSPPGPVRSVRVDNRKLLAVAEKNNRYTEWRGVPTAIREFQDRSPTDWDRNTPW